MRAQQGTGPGTISMDVGAIRLVLSHAAAVHGLPVSIEPIDLARIALKRLGLIGKSNERDRRPTEDELARLIDHFDSNPRQIIPMGRIIKFAVASTMRQEEICRVFWPDHDGRTKMLTIRVRKDPRAKKGNDQTIPLLAVSGYDANALVEDQRAFRANDDNLRFSCWDIWELDKEFPIQGCPKVQKTQPAEPLAKPQGRGMLPGMADRYVIRKDSTGYTVADNLTGEPLVLAMDPQTGLSEEDARHLAELFNRRATQGDRTAHS